MRGGLWAFRPNSLAPLRPSKSTLSTGDGQIYALDDGDLSTGPEAKDTRRDETQRRSATRY